LENNEYAENEDWVEAIGVLGFIERDGTQLAGMHLTSLRVLEERGNRFVIP